VHPITAMTLAQGMHPTPRSSPRPAPRRARRSRRLGRVGALALVGVLALGACGSDADDASSSAGSPAETTTTAAPVAGTVEVHAVDYAFTQLPERVEAGAKLTLVNDAEDELHELVAFRLPDDEERSVADLVALPQAELEGLFGESEPAMVLLAKPGEPQIEAVGDGTLTEPGRYLVACSIPTGADPDELLAADGPPPADAGTPHYHHGMWAELEVV